MAIDRWFIGGGAEHTPESARRLVYASTSGAEGVGGINDLKVLPLAVPGQGVRVSVGSALIRSRYVGGETQTYMGTVYTQETVSVTPTGSGGGRNDLVVMRVEDPYAAGSPYTPPAEGDRETAPYIHIRVISGVPAGTTKLQDVPGYQNDSAVTLARIVYPASTGTVTSGMIVDLREIAQPRTTRFVRTYAVVTGDNQQITSTSAYPTGGMTWPQAAVDSWLTLDVPEWATHARIILTWAGVTQPAGEALGEVWVQVGETVRPDEVYTQAVTWDAPGVSNRSRSTFIVADDIRIPNTMRGNPIHFFPRARRASGAVSASPIIDGGSAIILDVEFYERAV